MSDTFWSDLVESEDIGAAREGALAPEGSPERAKKALDLSNESGIPAPVIELNIEKVDKEIKTRQRYEDIKNSEGLKIYIQNDSMASKVSSDDFGVLSQVWDELQTFVTNDPVLKAMGEGFGTAPLGLTAGEDTEEFFKDIGLLHRPGRYDPGTLVTEPLIRGVASAFDAAVRSFSAWAVGAGASVEVIFNDINRAMGSDVTGSPEGAGRELTNFINFVLTRWGMERPFGPPPTNRLRRQMEIADELRKLKIKPIKPAEWNAVDPLQLRLEKQAIKSEYEAATLDLAVQAVQESKTRERSPAMFETFVKPATGERTIVISAAEANAVYQKRGLAPQPGDAILGWIPDIAQKIQHEMARGGDIQVPLSGYLTHIDPEVHKELLPSVRSADGMSINEIAEIQKEIEETLAAKELSAPPPVAAEKKAAEAATKIEPTTKEPKAPTINVEPAGEMRAKEAAPAAPIEAPLVAPVVPEAAEIVPDILAEPEPISVVVKKAKTALFLDPLFKDAESAGMTETEFRLYSDKVEASFKKAFEKDLERIQKQAVRELTKEWKDILKEEMDKAITEFDARLDVQAESFFRNGTLDPTATAVEAMKLDTNLVSQPNLRDFTAAGGANPDDMAGLLGYRTGAEMLDAMSALRDARGRKTPIYYKMEVARAQATTATRERFGDLEERIDAIVETITDPDISRVLYDELRVMQKQGGGTPLTFEELLRHSQTYFNYFLTVTEARRTQQFVRNLIRAGRKAEMALLRGKIPEAFKAKNEQLLTFFDVQQAVAFGKELKKATALIKKYAGKKVPKSVHPEYADQIQAILNSYGIVIKRPRVDLTAIKSLDKFLDEEYKLGLEIPIAQVLLEPRVQKDWKKVTVGEFRDMMESISSLDHVGREKLTGIRAGKKIELQLLHNEIITNVRTLPLRHKSLVGVRERLTEAKNFVDSYLTRMAEIISELDLGNPEGPITQSVYRMFLESQHKEVDVYFRGAIEHFEKLPRIEHSSRKIVGPWINSLTEKPYVFTKSDIVMMALNLGNRKNRDLVVQTIVKLPDHLYEHLAPSEIEVITAASTPEVIDFVNQHMTEKDWEFVVGLWDFFNKLKPEIDRLYRDITGVAPDTVEPLSIETPFGTMPGGYSRIIYDPVASDVKTLVKYAIFGAGYAKATTPNSYTMARTGVRKPFLVTGYYEMLPIEIRKMLHDLAFREALLNAQKVFSPEVRYEIRKHYGKEYERLIDFWFGDIANHFNAEDERLRWFVNISRVIRQNISTAALGLNPKLWITPNISPLIMNPLDFARFMQDPAGNMKFVMENSAEIRDRMLMVNRDIGDFLQGQIGLEGPVERARATAARVGMYVAVKQDAALASALWYGQYQRALEEGLSHEDAVFRSDFAVVRNFGSQTTMNLPLILRMGEMTKNFTMFLGFMNTAYNRQRTIVSLGRSGIKKIGGGDYAGGTRDIWMMVANTFAWVLALAAIGWVYNPNVFDEAEDWDDWAGGAVKLLISNMAAEMPFVREAAAYYLQNYNPRGHAFFTVFKEVGKPFEDIIDKISGEDVSDRWIEHAINSIGTVVGLPTAGPSRPAQYLWNVTTNQDDMDTFGDFMRGILFGRSNPNKK